MKKTYEKVALLLLLAAIPAVGSAREIKVQVKGMVCQFCSQGITKKFGAEDAVSKVHVDMGKKEVLLSLKDGKDISDEKITELILDSGVNVSKIER